MHRIWGIPELRTLIFELFDAKEYATAARVCKAFWTTAIPLLWKEAKFEDVLRLLRMKLRYLDPKHRTLRGPICKTCVVFKQLEEKDFGRFRSYARYIKKLDVEIPSCPSLPTLLRRLDQFQPLWPELREVDIQLPRSEDNIPSGLFFPVFFGPALKRLSLDFHTGIPGFAHVLDDTRRGLVERVEEMETLGISFNFTSRLSSEEAGELALLVSAHSTSLRGLKLAIIPELPSEVLQPVLDMPNLKRAHLGFLEAISKNTQQGGGLGHLFATGQAVPVGRFIDSPSAASVAHLNVGISVEDDLELQSMPDLTAALNRLERLQTLTLRITDMTSHLFTAYPVATFNRTQKLWLDFPYREDPITAHEIEVIAENMPLLTHLHIDIHPYWGSLTTLTLHDLQPLGKNCHNLQLIFIALNGSAGDLARLSHPMHSVEVVQTHLSSTMQDSVNLKQVAEYIRHLWPNLRLSYSAYPAKRSTYLPPWCRVWDLVGAKDSSMPGWAPDESDDWQEIFQ